MPNILKKLSTLLAGLTLMFGSVDAKQSENVETKKSLIVYFSHIGNTKLIAERAQKELAVVNYQVDLYRLEPTNPYPEYGDKLRDLAKEESENDNCRPEFEAINVDVQSYDLVLVGTPVWWYKAPKIVLSFLEKQDFANKKVCFFITHGGGPGSCLEDMKGASRNAIFGPHTTIYFTWPNDGTFDNKAFDNWIKKIKNETEN